jgi:hypothetical protein
MARLARAVQVKANLSRESIDYGPQRQSNADTRKELQALATLANKLIEGIEGLSNSADRAAFWAAFGYFQSHEEAPPGSPTEGYFNFSDGDFRHNLTEPLARLADILDMATWTAGNESPAPRWREA